MSVPLERHIAGGEIAILLERLASCALHQSRELHIARKMGLLEHAPALWSHMM
jgi:hypothetical protein